jgi:hypothetical protein
MPADYESDPECRWIEQCVKKEAVGIHTAQCGKQPNGDYELWLQLLPNSRAQRVLITETEYGQGESNVWKEKIGAALEKLNS